MNLRIVVSHVVFALATAALSGCGGTPSNPHLVPVSGVVTMDGRPLAGASVTFVGLGSTPGEGATGLTDEAGKYELAHFRAGSGALPGEYKVIVNKFVMPDGSAIPIGTLSAAELGIRDVLPPRYGDYSATLLKANVMADGPSIDFSLSAR
jgi:hypothetical protein